MMAGGISHAHSVVQPSPLSRRVASVIVVAYAVITMVPLAWIFLTGFKSGPDSIAYPPKVLFKPSRKAIAICSRRARGKRRSTSRNLPPPTGVCDALARGPTW
jgi:multiple sugar transport system permease protein